MKMRVSNVNPAFDITDPFWWYVERLRGDNWEFICCKRTKEEAKLAMEQYRTPPERDEEEFDDGKE